MYIKQISIYLENVKGSLLELTKILGENDINLLALSIADTTGFGIVRTIVKSDQVDKALEVLRSGGYICKVNRVIGVRVNHAPGGLAYVLSTINDSGLSVEYIYSFCRSSLEDAVIIIRPSDKEECVKALEAAGVMLVSQEQVDEF